MYSPDDSATLLLAEIRTDICTYFAPKTEAKMFRATQFIILLVEAV